MFVGLFFFFLFLLFLIFLLHELLGIEGEGLLAFVALSLLCGLHIAAVCTHFCISWIDVLMMLLVKGSFVGIIDNHFHLLFAIARFQVRSKHVGELLSLVKARLTLRA